MKKEWWKHMNEDEKDAYIRERAEEIAKYCHGIDTSIGRQSLRSYLALMNRQ